jgi:formylglycine-generating enzyme required for sulfatase activity
MSAASILHKLRSLEQAGLIELDPRALIDVIKILDLVGEEHTEALAHSLASRLTHEPTRHAHLLNALLAMTPVPAPAAARGREGAPPTGPQRGSETAPPQARLSRRLWRMLRRLSGVDVLVLLSVASLAVVLTGPFATRAIVAEIKPDAVPAAPSEPAPEDPPPIQADLPPPPPEILTPTVRLDPIEGSRRTASTTPHEDPLAPPGPLWLAVGLFLGGILVVIVGAGWWGAPAHYRRLAALARARARTQREDWGAKGHVSAVPYHIERADPFPVAHIDDAATILDRLFRREASRELDVPATISTTLDAGGRITPVHAASRRREHLLVLVDRESRQHPYLDGVEWMLARWRRLGLRVLRYTYENTPDALRPEHGPEHGPELTLDALRSQTAGLPLLVLSRMRGARGYQGRVALARDLTAWPHRAWLDLDPTPLADRDRERQRLARTLERSGLPRYPFTAPGLLAAARGLAEGVPRHRLVSEPAPRPGLDTALMVWAGTVACVPDASWAQLDALRRHFAGFSDLTPDHGPLAARDLERLLAWVGARGYHSGVLGEGARLYFTPAGRRELLRALRRHDRQRWPDDPDRRYEARARRLLIQQLMAADIDGDPYRASLRDMKVAVHEAVLDPARADALLPGFADKAVVYELMEQLEDELALQANDDALDQPWSAATCETLTAYVQGKARARLPDLLGLPRLGIRQWAAAMALGVASVGCWGLWWSSWPTMQVVEQARVVEIPPTWKVVEVAGADPLVARADVAPMKFVKIPGGAFEMGSPNAERERFKKLYPDLDDSYFADERLHRVEVSPFELAETEVTNAQWKAVMGTSPSDCDYGCADNHPVQNVTWVMAVEYLNKLTARENTGLTPCYEQREDAWVWVESCTGYRLPTEAEWEYAARAATRTAYSFGDDPKDLCKHGNGADQAAKRENAEWTVSDCDDGAANLAEVGKYVANPWGLQDMHGNVWEWVWDRYDGKYGDTDNDKVTRDPRGPQNGEERVLRGGSFWNVPRRLRSADRNWDGLRPSNAVVSVGFRCARGSPPAH